MAVPTPTDRAKMPDLSPLVEATRLVFESTVFPGCTEQVCIPLLERESGLAAIHRDLNIALMNELAMLFHRLGLNTVRDTPNSQVFDLIGELRTYRCEVYVHDPLVLGCYLPAVSVKDLI